MRISAAAVAALVAVTLAGPSALAAERRPVDYRVPVDGPVRDPFRPPATPYGAGNRGVEYGTAPGAAVRAAAEGEVVFAGQVGGGLHVVVLHADGLRTSYSFLRSVGVRRGQRVAAGASVGTSEESLHWGARAGDAYIDPLKLLDGPVRVYLVPDGLDPPQSEDSERAGLVRFLRPLASGGRMVGRGLTSGGRLAGRGLESAAAAAVELPASAADAARHQVVDAIGRLAEGPLLPGAPPLTELLLEEALAFAHRAVADVDCTPADAPVPPRPPGRRRVVLVAGLGSSSDHASIQDVDTAALGYRPNDVVKFSYRGGTSAQRPYRAEDTLADLRQSGRRLRELLDRMKYDDPGVTVDLIAHSQGGLVVREALATELDPFDPRSPRIGNIVTLASPHRGADLATAAALLRHTPKGRAVRELVGRVGRSSALDPDARSVRQMAETSDFLRKLNRRPLPHGVRFTSIAARNDVVVPSPRSRLRGARNVVVGLPGLGNDHARLPGSAAAHREMALALAGAPPTCESLGDAAADAAAGRLIADAERVAGLAAFAASAR